MVTHTKMEADDYFQLWFLSHVCRGWGWLDQTHGPLWKLQPSVSDKLGKGVDITLCVFTFIYLADVFV